MVTGFLGGTRANILLIFQALVIFEILLLSPLWRTLQCEHSRSKQRTDQMVLVLTLKFLALKKPGFSPRNKYFPKIFLTCVYLCSMQLFSADPTMFSKKN